MWVLTLSWSTSPRDDIRLWTAITWSCKEHQIYEMNQAARGGLVKCLHLERRSIGKILYSANVKLVRLQLQAPLISHFKAQPPKRTQILVKLVFIRLPAIGDITQEEISSGGIHLNIVIHISSFQKFTVMQLILSFSHSKHQCNIIQWSRISNVCCRR